MTLRFGEQHYFRTAKDLDLKGLSVRPSFDRGSPSSATAKSSTNSPMTIASSTSSNSNQEAQDEQAAGEAIQWQVKHDYPIVKERLLHQWTPQVSSKQVGLKADGLIWNNRSILAEYLRTRQANPNAVIIDTSQWPVYDDKDWWVTLAGRFLPRRRPGQCLVRCPGLRLRPLPGQAHRVQRITSGHHQVPLRRESARLRT